MILPLTPELKATGGIDTDQDIIKIAVLERHHRTGHVGLGFLTGYGLKRGAVASSVAHDAHNLIVTGTNDEDMAVAAERVRQMGGGFALAEGGAVIAELALPAAGLMSELTVEKVAEILEELKAKAEALGVPEGIDPFMTLAFVSLPTIPDLRINGKGLINVLKQEIVTATF